MRILHANRFYHIAGGVSRYFLEVAELLKSHGHEVAYFSMHDKQNKKSKGSRYFVNNISFEKVEFKNAINIFYRMFYFIEARRNISKLLDNIQPDIAHIHNIYHHISPSILLELKKRNIPIVHTVGDYHLISPHHNNLFHNGKTCEVSKVHRFYNTVIHKCVKNSYFASFAEAIEQYIHYMFGFYRNTIDYYIAPSKFLFNKLAEYQIPKEKIVLLPYFIDNKKYKPNYDIGDYVLYFGRLYPEKGLLLLIEIAKLLPNIKFKIIGKGPEDEKIKRKINEYNLKNIEIVSKFIPDKELKSFISHSRFIILPSISYESFGISILESFASGKPVIASNIGGIPETVKDGFNGFLFEPGNVEDMANKISKLWNNPELCRKLGKNAREYAEKNFGPEEHYEKLMKIYKKAINKYK